MRGRDIAWSQDLHADLPSSPLFGQCQYGLPISAKVDSSENSLTPIQKLRNSRNPRLPFTAIWEGHRCGVHPMDSISKQPGLCDVIRIKYNPSGPATGVYSPSLLTSLTQFITTSRLKTRCALSLTRGGYSASDTLGDDVPGYTPSYSPAS